MGLPTGHRINDLRSLRLHRAVAALIEGDVRLLDRVRDKLAWLETRGMAPIYARKWREILNRPLPEILAFITEDSEEAAALRQSSPFTAAALIPPRDRWRIFREAPGESRAD